MSTTGTTSVACPQCGAKSEVKVFKTVNVTTDRNFREQLLSGEMLHFTCPSCGHEAELRYPLLYNDINNKFMVYFVPDVDRDKVTDEALEKEYGDLAGIRRRLVGDYNELKEKIHIFESGLDDRVIEVVKAALKDIVQKRTGDTVTGGYLSKYSVSEDRIGFTFFVGENHEQFVQTTRLEIYDKSAAVAKAVKEDENDRSFRAVNREWARNALYQYKKSKV